VCVRGRRPASHAVTRATVREREHRREFILGAKLPLLSLSFTTSLSFLSPLSHEGGEEGGREPAPTTHSSSPRPSPAHRHAAMATASGGAGAAGGSGGGGGDDQLHGLKFGKKIYFEDAVGGSGSGSAPPPRPASPRSTGGGGGRRGRGAAGGASSSSAPPARCQVEGCNVDLTGVKTYYYRHKVCNAHSKTPLVIVNGIEQRFCQQCSR
jgi:hypothetical protein